MRFAAALFLAIACSPAFASDPGRPLDCSDFVSLEPGHTCIPWVPFGCQTVSASSPFCLPTITNAVFDNEGRQYRFEAISVPANCCSAGGVCQDCNRFQIVRFDGVSQSVIGYFNTRFDGMGGIDTFWPPSPDNPMTVEFDEKNGRLLVWLQNYSNTSSYQPSHWVAAIGGFATLFDVLQTFVPQPASIGFRVPVMPEGMPAADHFDTYWGPLAHPIDFTQAHPLQCGYPATPPHVGDYLTVDDTLPTPTPGTGYYYVTAATYQGQMRYGRKATAGHLSGRDPAVLPACTTP